MKSISKTCYILLLALCGSTLVFALPADDLGGDTEGPTNNAPDCLFDTSVRHFSATPNVVNPWAGTTLKWDVAIPSDCQLSIYLLGKKVNPKGNQVVTPLFPENTYSLEGRMLTVRGSVAQIGVSVNTASCDEESFPVSLIKPIMQTVLDQYDENEPGIYQTRDADVSITEQGLAVKMYLKAEIPGPNPSVVLSMRFKFTTRDGIVDPRFLYFHPQASTYLPDDWVESKFYQKSNEILATFKTAVNDVVSNSIDDQEEKLLSLETLEQEILATICPIPRPVIYSPFPYPDNATDVLDIR